MVAILFRYHKTSLSLLQTQHFNRVRNVNCGMWNGKWEMGNGKWEMGNGKWEMGNGKLDVTGQIGYKQLSKNVSLINRY